MQTKAYVRDPLVAAASETYRWSMPTFLLQNSNGDDRSRSKSKHTFQSSIAQSSLVFGSADTAKESVVLAQVAQLKRQRRGLTNPFDRFEIAAQLGDCYRSVKQYAKAESWYQEALLSVTEEDLVNQYRPQVYTLEDRKVQRMSKPKIAEYYETKAAELAQLVEAALQQQHGRHFHCRQSLFETSLQLGAANKAIGQADLLIELCARKGEQHALECKQWIHQALVANHKAVKRACNRIQLIEHGQHSECGEYHLRLILDLLTTDPTSVDLLTWAGRLYAEKCQLGESKYYFQRAAANGAEVHEPPPKYEIPVQPPLLWSYQVEASIPDDAEDMTGQTKPAHRRPIASAQAIIYPTTNLDLEKGVLPVRQPKTL